MSGSSTDEAWAAELEKIHQQVQEARRLLQKGEIPDLDIEWKPPTLEKLPASLKDQAETLQAELSELEGRIEAAMQKNRNDRDKLRRSPEKKSDSRPIYLDVES